MNRRSAIAMGLILAGSAVLWHAHDASGQAAQTGWTTLFDGSNLNNWEPIGNANWRLLEGGIVQADLGNGFLSRSRNTATSSSGRVLGRCHRQQRRLHPRHRSQAGHGGKTPMRSTFSIRARPELRHRRDRQCCQGVANAQGRQPVEHL